jgi:hypothetical protein
VLGLAVESAREAGAEKRIHNEISVFKREPIRARDFACPSPRRFRRIALELARGTEACHLHIEAELTQHARRDITVAAVVSRAAQYGDAPRTVRLESPRRRARDRRARRFHQ